MNKFQVWVGGFMMIFDGIATLFSCRAFGLYIGYIEWCIRRKFKSLEDERNK